MAVRTRHSNSGSSNNGSSSGGGSTDAVSCRSGRLARRRCQQLQPRTTNFFSFLFWRSDGSIGRLDNERTAKVRAAVAAVNTPPRAVSSLNPRQWPMARTIFWFFWFFLNSRCSDIRWICAGPQAATTAMIERKGNGKWLPGTVEWRCRQTENAGHAHLHEFHCDRPHPEP
jgi:hypothetical protein